MKTLLFTPLRFTPLRVLLLLLSGLAALPVQALTTLTFDELPFQPVDGLSLRGVTFGFRVDGAASSDATYDTFGPGIATFVHDPSLEGNSAGVLTLQFALPVTLLEFGVALNTDQPLSPGFTVELFEPEASLGIHKVDTRPLIFFTEGRFTHAGSPVSRAVIHFNTTTAARFSLDNLTFDRQLLPQTVLVEVFGTHTTDTGGGAPYSDFTGALTAPDVSFATSTDYDWHPLALPAFGARITGCLEIPETKTVTFGLNSDDGSLLYLDDVLLVDNGNAHPPQLTTGSPFSLTGGQSYPFRIEFYEDFGGESGVDLLIDEHEGKGFQIVPPSLFTACSPDQFDLYVPGHPESPLILRQGDPPTLTFTLQGFEPIGQQGYRRTGETRVPSLQGAGRILDARVVGRRIEVLTATGKFVSGNGFLYQRASP